MLYPCINFCFWYIEANFVVVGKIYSANQSRILFSKGMVFLFFTFTLNALRFLNHGKKGEGNGNSSNQQKVRGLNNISKVIGLVKDEDLGPKTILLTRANMKSDKIKNWPVKERPRERLIAEGAERLTDAELLAIILRVGRGTFTEGVLGQNATDFAKELLTEFKGLRGLDIAHTEDLRKVPGLGTAKVAQIKAAFEIGKRVQSKRLTAISFETSSDVAAHFRPRFTGKRQEVVIGVFLNGQNQSLGEKEITEGTPTQATVYVRRILEEALHVSAAAIVMVHNHPSGNSEPSAGDDDTTCRLLAACNLVEIVLLDHIIVGETEHYSYSDSGRLKELEEI